MKYYILYNNEKLEEVTEDKSLKYQFDDMIIYSKIMTYNTDEYTVLLDPGIDYDVQIDIIKEKLKEV